MPNYAYDCTRCGGMIDIIHSASEPARTECPECGGQTLERLFVPIPYLAKTSPAHPRRGRGLDKAGGPGPVEKWHTERLCRQNRRREEYGRDNLPKLFDGSGMM